MQAKVTFKGDVREINIDFRLDENNMLDCDISVVPELTSKDDASELETKLAYMFLNNLEKS